MTDNLKLVKKHKDQIPTDSESARRPTLTPAEQLEAARFKARTAAKAIRRARVHRLMNELEKPDEIAPAA